MIKLDDHIFELALCIVDQTEKITEMSIKFFDRFSKKKDGEAIYNSIFDIIVKLTEKNIYSREQRRAAHTTKIKKQEGSKTFPKEYVECTR